MLKLPVKRMITRRSITSRVRMSIEVEALLQEAKENIEAAQNYRAELQQRLQGLNQARKQSPRSFSPPHPSVLIPSLRQLLSSAETEAMGYVPTTLTHPLLLYQRSTGLFVFLSASLHREAPPSPPSHPPERTDCLGLITATPGERG
ncbi:Cytokine receptor-like factor 3-like [Arapaima gigas]